MKDLKKENYLKIFVRVLDGTDIDDSVLRQRLSNELLKLGYEYLSSSNVFDEEQKIRADERKKTLEEVSRELEQVELNQKPSSTLYTDKDVVVSLFEIRKILSKLSK